MFNPEGNPFRIEVTYDAEGRLTSEMSVRSDRRIETTRTVTRAFDERDRLVRSALTVRHDGTDDLEDIDDVVEYRYDECTYAIADLAPEGRHVALTAAGVDWTAHDVFAIR